jgi:hypothetical protein
MSERIVMKRVAWVATFFAAAFTVFVGCHRELHLTFHEGRSVAQAALQRLHAECSSDRDCGLSQVCIRWADEASRERNTCEVTCEPSKHEPDSQCPYPLICVTVIDGPGTTCQKRVGPL